MDPYNMWTNQERPGTVSMTDFRISSRSIVLNEFDASIFRRTISWEARRVIAMRVAWTIASVSPLVPIAG